MGWFKRFWNSLTGADRVETLYEFPAYKVDPVTDKVIEEVKEDAVLAEMNAAVAESVPPIKLSKGMKVYVQGYNMQHKVFSIAPNGKVNLRYRDGGYWYNRSGVPMSKILMEKPAKKG